MAGVRFTAIQTSPLEVLEWTRLTVDELQQVVPSFEAAFQTPMAHWRFDGQPRPARRYTTDTHCPLPTPEDRLLLILGYLKTYALPVVHGRLLGMGHSQANQWMHVLLGVLQATLRALGEAPTRSVRALAHRLGVAEADAAAVVMPPPAPPTPSTPPTAAPARVPAAPLVATLAPNGPSYAPKTRLNTRAVIAARKHATR